MVPDGLYFQTKLFSNQPTGNTVFGKSTYLRNAKKKIYSTAEHFCPSKISLVRVEFDLPCVL